MVKQIYASTAKKHKNLLPALVVCFSPTPLEAYGQGPRTRRLDGTRRTSCHTGRISYRDSEILPKPTINCMVIRHFGLLAKNANKGGKFGGNGRWHRLVTCLWVGSPYGAICRWSLYSTNRQPLRGIEGNPVCK